MRIGPYKYTGFKEFPGLEYKGYSFSITKGTKKFAEFIDYGNGGEPELKAFYTSDKDKTALNHKLTAELIAYAEHHPITFPSAPEINVPSHEGNYLNYLENVMYWWDIENVSKKAAKDTGFTRNAAVLIHGSIPEAIIEIFENDVDYAVGRLLDGIDDVTEYSIAVLPIGPYDFPDGFPTGTPATEYIKRGKK